MKLGSSACHSGTWAKLAHDHQGTSVIELAIAAPVLLMLLAGVTDLGGGLTERYRLQQAVNRTLEMAQSGRDADFAFLVPEAAAAAEVPVSDVVQEQWLECANSQVRRDWLDECTAGDAARYVKLTITGSYMPLFGPMSYWTVQSNGTVKMTAHATLRVR
jgi:hypothetical protein